jgi:hypothetical protein
MGWPPGGARNRSNSGFELNRSAGRMGLTLEVCVLALPPKIA